MLFGPVFRSVLAVCLLIMPITSWSNFSHFTPASSELIDLSEVNQAVSMIDCHQQATVPSQQSVDCCNSNNSSSDAACFDCPDNCQSTAPFSKASNHVHQWAFGHDAVQGMLFIISSVRMAALFRPPISILS